MYLTNEHVVQCAITMGFLTKLIFEKTIASLRTNTGIYVHVGITFRQRAKTFLIGFRTRTIEAISANAMIRTV